MKGISWSLLDAIINYGIKTIFSLYIARILFPSDYSLIGITYIIFSVIEVLVTSGLGQAYIYKKESGFKTASTIFTINLILSTLFWLLLFFSRNSIADFFHREELLDVLPVLSFVILFNAFNVIRISHLRKTFRFDILAKSNVLSFISSGLVGLTLALNGFGYWSLVLQQLVGKLTLTFSLRAWTSLKVGLLLDVKILKELYKYSLWLLINGLLNRAFENIYRLVIGKYHDKSQLGLYEKGNQFPALVYQQIFWAFSSVSFSTSTSLRDTPVMLSSMHFKFIKYFNYISVPILFTLYFNADAFVVLVLTAKWLAIVPFLKLFCLVGVVIPFFNFNVQLLQATGKTRQVFFILLAFNSLRLINAIFNGINSIELMIAWEVVIDLISVAMSFLYLRMCSLILVKDLLSVLYRFFILSFSTILLLYFLGYLNHTSYWTQLFFNTGCVAFLSLILIYILDRLLLCEIYDKMLGLFILIKR